ncbi:mitochondrial ribosomal protein L19 precursor [Klebsormidium nitens]|uniref:Mitochondrial ribosomal protein L19 n=1 Tax=Klebsormidium nitens TaxID=105231 RepID=A0A1Y1I856_KLENI|nr:mitochondrial ribosomal protein L19 precursor [Klebsormidium nitens]|eukprot:GAQ85609.1 mitochondrial ribosomal protein L19 precursor [Klebsormidium nitens]
MGLKQLCVGSAIRQALRTTARPKHNMLKSAATLQDAAEFTDSCTERSKSTYSASTSSPSLEPSSRILGAEPSSPCSTQRARFDPPSFSSRIFFRPFRPHCHKSSSQFAVSAASFRQPGASFATTAFLAGPSLASGAPDPSNANQTVSNFGTGSSDQQKEVSKLRPAFKRKTNAKAVQGSADVPPGARQLATAAAAQSGLRDAPVSGGSMDQGVGKPARALPPLPPRKKTKALRKTAQHIMNILDQEAVAELKQKKNYPDFRPGDVLELDMIVPENRRRTAVVRGVCLARRNRGVGSTFVIRRVVAGEGMEYTYPLYSPNIQEIKIIERRPVRRAKLFYLRDWNPRECTV